jgi:hypothetical protein
MRSAASRAFEMSKVRRRALLRRLRAGTRQRALDDWNVPDCCRVACCQRIDYRDVLLLPDSLTMKRVFPRPVVRDLYHPLTGSKPCPSLQRPSTAGKPRSCAVLAAGSRVRLTSRSWPGCRAGSLPAAAARRPPRGPSPGLLAIHGPRFGPRVPAWFPQVRSPQRAYGERDAGSIPAASTEKRAGMQTRKSEPCRPDLLFRRFTTRRPRAEQARETPCERTCARIA